MSCRSASGGWLLTLLACVVVARGAEPALPTSDPFAEPLPNGSPDAPLKAPLGSNAIQNHFPAPPAPTQRQIQGWIKDLDSDKFAAREAATDELSKANRAAIPALAAAVESKSPEVHMRAMRILEELYEGADTATRAAAQQALAKIAAEPKSQGTKRANEILSPPNMLPSPEMMFGGGGGRRRRMGGGFGRMANFPNFQTMVVNGHKKVDVDSGARRIHIEEEPQGAITIWITEIENGRERTRSFTAKNLDDLNKTQPAEARQLYQQYMTGWAGPVQLRGGAVNLRPPGP